jgi:phosphate transport system substrate-binding protein
MTLGKQVRMVAVLSLLALTIAACGGGSTNTTAGTSDTTAAAGSETTAGDAAGGAAGNIVVSGSSTVQPITEVAAAAWGADNPDVAISVDGPGTSDGFARFCNNETDISDASRAIDEDEVALCEQAGVEYVELLVGLDGLSVITSTNNADVTCLDFNDLYALLGPESEGFANWSDANDLAAELGAGHAPYPEAPLVITAPGEESGTYDFFVETVIEPIQEERVPEDVDGDGENDYFTRADYQSSGNDNVIIEGIAGNDTSLGWVGYAFYIANEGTVKAIEVDGGEGCVAPSIETVADGTYPISRPLFIYVKTNDLASRSELVSFIDFYLSDEGISATTEAGYVDAPDLEATRTAWEDAKAATGG